MALIFRSTTLLIIICIIIMANQIMYCRKKTKNFQRSSMVFQECILNIDAVRLAVQNNGFKPCNTYSLGVVEVKYGCVVWLRLFRMPVQYTLHSSPFFDVFRTPNMGLGLRSLRTWLWRCMDLWNSFIIWMPEDMKI